MASASASHTAAPARATRSSHAARKPGSQAPLEEARAIVPAMLRVSATACSRRASSGARSCEASTRAAAARRRFRRPLSRAWRRTAQASEMSRSSSRVRSTHRSASARLAARPRGAGDVGQQGAQAIVDDVDLTGRGAVVQRRPDQEVDEQPDDDPAHGVEQPRPDHARVGAVTGEQDDERRRGGGGRLVAQHARAPDGQRHEQHDPERRGVDAEQRTGAERQQHAHDRGGHLLGAARERSIDGGVHGQQRGPRREERLREPEDRPRQHPREHRGSDGLDEQERVAPHHGVSQSLAHGVHRTGMPDERQTDHVMDGRSPVRSPR